MRSDPSNLEGALHEPLTPVELELKQNIKKNRYAVEKAVYEVLVTYGGTPEQSREFLSSNFDKLFYSYVEQVFPLTTSSVEPFVSYVKQFTATRAELDRQSQSLYERSRYFRTSDPKGKVSLPYPEVL